MAAHASYLLAGHDLVPVDEGLSHAARRPGPQLYLLAEGESRWPGAVTFRWPDSDAYRKLTRNHYRVVSLSPIPPAGASRSCAASTAGSRAIRDAAVAVDGRRRGAPRSSRAAPEPWP